MDNTLSFETLNGQELSAHSARAQLVDELPVNEKTYNLTGIHTCCLESGSGTPLILLHGPGESSLWWMRVIPGLAKNFRLIIPDLPGHGESKTGDAALDSDVLCRWLDEFIKATCSSPPVLVGHLLGGAIAAQYTIRYDKHIEQLILVDSFGLARFRPSPRFAFGLIKFLIRPSADNYDSFLPHCMFDAQKLQQEMGKNWKSFLTYNLSGANNPEFKTTLRTLMKKMAIPTIPEEDLAKIQTPVSLIWGRHDKALKLRIAESASKRYGWPLYVIDKARDDPKLERPEEFIQALSKILKITSPVLEKNKVL